MTRATHINLESCNADSRYFTRIIIIMEYMLTVFNPQRHCGSNMEPPDEQYDNAQFSICIKNSFFLPQFGVISSKPCVVPITLLKLRGGGNGKELAHDFDARIFEVPILTKNQFMWDTFPCIDFAETILTQFKNGLMSTGDKDATLYETAEETDPGGTAGTPPAGTLNPATAADKLIIDGNKIRKLKLFGVLCNYTNPKTEIYRMFFRSFNSDGPSVWKFIKRHGPLPTPQLFIRAREDSWKQLTYDKLKYPYTIHGLFRYVDTILHLARRINKDGHACKSKFVDGLPPFMQHVTAALRHENKAVYPGNYGTDPRFAGSPMAGTAHPRAGQPDIEQLARNYMEDFIMAAGRSMNISPDGLAAMCSEAFATDLVMLSSDEVNSDTSCFYCGAKGHAASCILSDGTRLICPVRAMGHPGIKSAKAILEPESVNSPALSIKSLEESVCALNGTIVELREHILSLQTTSNTSRNSRRTNSRKPGTSTAHELHDEYDDTDYDDESVGSEAPDMSAIHEMADAVAPAKFGKRRPYSPNGTRKRN